MRSSTNGGSHFSLPLIISYVIFSICGITFLSSRYGENDFRNKRFLRTMIRETQEQQQQQQKKLSNLRGKQQQPQSYVAASSELLLIEDTNKINPNAGCQVWTIDLMKRWKEDYEIYAERMQEKMESNTALFTPDLRKLYSKKKGKKKKSKEEICSQYADIVPLPTAPPTKIVDTSSSSEDQQPLLSGIDTKKMVAELRRKNRRRRRLTATSSSKEDDEETKETTPTNNNNNINDDDNNILQEYFIDSREQLSYMEKQGYMEPILMPYHHPDMCFPGVEDSVKDFKFDYIIEDFGHICRHSLLREEGEKEEEPVKTVFVDLGNSNTTSTLIKKYNHFGIYFDEYYGYEKKKKQHLVDDEYYFTESIEDIVAVELSETKTKFHWNEDDISTDVGHVNNPWTKIMENYNVDDFVVVKLENMSSSEQMLALLIQLLVHPKNKNKDTPLIDVLYFDYNIIQSEIERLDGDEDDDEENKFIILVELLTLLRQLGIATHDLS